LKLPPFLSKPAGKVDPGTPDSETEYDSARQSDLVASSTYRHRENKRGGPHYTPLLCRLKLTFDTGKVLEGKVTVHHDEFENRVWGNTPEGPRHMALSHIASITLEKRNGR